MGDQPVRKVIFDTKSDPVYVVHPTSSLRMQLVDVLRGLGFADVIGAADISEATQMLSNAVAEKKLPKWILTPLFAGAEANALQLGALIAHNQDLQGISWSLIATADEEYAVQFALENGVLSCHSADVLSQAGGMQKELEQLMSIAAALEYESEMITLYYTRNFLRRNKHHAALVKMTRTMVELNPRNAEVLFCYADALALNGKLEDSKRACRQAVWADPNLLTRVKEILTANGEPLLSPDDIKALDATKASVLEAFGVTTCVIVDSDSSARVHVKNAMAQLGVNECIEFEDGESAWNHLKAKVSGSLLVTEWKLRKISGMALLQRMAQAGIQEVPVLVVSAQLGAKDKGLLEELGTAVLLQKPLTLDALIASIRSAVKEENMPSAYKGAIRKVRGLMRQGQVRQAKKLWNSVSATTLIPAVYQKATDAELRLAEGKLEDAYAACHAAVALGARGAYFYNLMGKILGALGDYDRASAWLNKANEEVPMNIDRLAEMAAVEMHRGDLDKAAELVEKAATVDATNEKVVEAKAMLAIEKGDQSAATEVLQQLNDMMNVVAHLNNRAVTMAWKGDPDKGIDLYRQALLAAPKAAAGEQKSFSPSVTYNLAMALARKGDYAGASKILDELDLQGIAKQDPRLVEKIKGFKIRVSEAASGRGTMNLETPKTSELSKKRIQHLNKVAEMAQAKAALLVRELKVSDTIDYRAVKMAEKPLYFKPKKAAS